MTLQSQLFSLPFAAGQDEKPDPRWVQPGTQTSLVNIQLGRPGSYRKRNGFGVYGGSGSYTPRSLYGHSLVADTYQRAMPLRDSLAIVNGGRVWNLASSTKVLYDVDAVTPILGRTRPLDSTAKAITSFDCVITPNGIIVAVYCANSVLYAGIFDPSNDGTVSWVPSIVAADYVRAVTVPTVLGPHANNVYLVTQQSGTPATLQFQVIDTVAMVINPQTSVTDATIAGAFDACTWDGANAPATFVVAYAQTGGLWAVKTVDPGGAITGAASFTPAGSSPVVQNVAVRATYGEQIWVAHVETVVGPVGKLRVMGLDSATLATTTADVELDTGHANARIGIERVDSTHALVAWSVNPNYGMATSWNQVTAIAGTLGQKRTMQQMALASTPFTIDGKVYAQTLFSSSSTPPTITPGATATQPAPTAYLVDLLASDSSTVNQTAQWRATVAPRIIAGNATTIAYTQVPHVAITGLSAYVPIPTIRSGSDPNGLDVAIYAKTNALHQAARLGSCTYLSGGVPSCFDGKRVTELGFAYNVATNGALTQGAGGGIADGAYTYAFVWEWHDAAGQRKQSAPVYASIIVSAGGGTASVSATAPDLSLTLCQDSESNWDPKVALAIYRTAPTATAGVFYRLFGSDVPPGLLSVPYGSSSVTYPDTHADIDITGNEQLYTLGGVVSGVCPPSFTSVIAHNGRLVGIGDDEQTLWYSTAWDGGTTQPRFNDSFTLTIPSDGRITAIASQDGQLIAFTKTEIFVIAGDGPDEAGMGATWSLPPQRVPTDVGCDADWRAVLATPNGIIFQCGSRLYLLSRSHEVTYFSKGVESTLASYPVITSMALTASQEQLRITCRASANSQVGRILTFDYVGGGWSIYDVYDSDAAQAHFGTDSACQTSAGYVWLGKNGSAWFENANSYLDPGSTWVSYSIESAWMKPADILGFVRFRWVQLMAEKGSDADLSISIADDYSDTYAQIATFTAQQLNDGQFTAKTEIKAHVVRQKSSAIRVKISDATPTNGTVGTGQGYSLVGLTIEGGIKRGLRKLPATQAR